MDRLKGKVAMVVGAGSIGPGWGNGKATAVTFAREGAQVFCVDRNPAAAAETVGIITKEGGNAMAHTADVSKAAEVEAMVAACLKAYGHIDVVDNNVGILCRRANILLCHRPHGLGIVRCHRFRSASALLGVAS